MSETIVAVCSTLIGTIVGWFLGQINLGKIYVSLSDYNEEYMYVDVNTMSIPGKEPNELYLAKLSFSINLYNSAPVSNVVQDFALEFLDNEGKVLSENLVKDEKSKTQHPYGVDYRTVEVLNVAAHESVRVKGIVWINEIEQMYKIQSIRLKYSDAKFRIKHIAYKEIDFKSIPRFNQIVEKGGTQ